MYLLENPVLQRELLANLRMKRAFLLLFGYVGLLGGMVYLAWPQDTQLDVTNPEAAIRLVNLFFLGQYMVASLMAPSFAAGAITGEKERKTYEMLLASPLRPGAIVVGKLLADLCHLALMIFSSLPIVMLCLPLGGTSLYEVLAVYFALLLTTTTFGIISLACSSYFQRTMAALVVSYLVILPLALAGLVAWLVLGEMGSDTSFRLFAVSLLLPLGCAALWAGLIGTTSQRLLYPPDLGSEGKEVVDEEEEMDQAVGLVIRRDRFPDRLFAPPKRAGLLPEGANPVYDKEMRSEIFSQGTLMLRIVIQVSMFLAIPLMLVCLYVRPQDAAWYIAYVLLFNMLVGPVFSAGTVTSERERETLDLLLTTLITPGQILSGKLISGLRVSFILTMFVMWPVALACLMVTEFWINLPAMGAYLVIVMVTCLATAIWALFCSVICRKSSVSLMISYLGVVTFFAAPLGMQVFAETFFDGTPMAQAVESIQFISPVSTAFQIPLDFPQDPDITVLGNWDTFYWFLGFYAIAEVVLMGVMSWLFRVRWRVAY